METTKREVIFQELLRNQEFIMKELEILMYDLTKNTCPQMLGFLEEILDKIEPTNKQEKLEERLGRLEKCLAKLDQHVNRLTVMVTHHFGNSMDSEIDKI